MNNSSQLPDISTRILEAKLSQNLAQCNRRRRCCQGRLLLLKLRRGIPGRLLHHILIIPNGSPDFTTKSGLRLILILILLELTGEQSGLLLKTPDTLLEGLHLIPCNVQLQGLNAELPREDGIFIQKKLIFSSTLIPPRETHTKIIRVSLGDYRHCDREFPDNTGNTLSWFNMFGVWQGIHKQTKVFSRQRGQVTEIWMERLHQTRRALGWQDA